VEVPETTRAPLRGTGDISEAETVLYIVTGDHDLVANAETAYIKPFGGGSGYYLRVRSSVADS
jgi:hypothetical protein